MRQELGEGRALAEQEEIVEVLVKDCKEGVKDITSLGFNGDALNAEMDDVRENKELLPLDSASVVDELVEERGACKVGKLFKVGQFFANSTVVLEPAEGSQKLHEEEQKEKSTVKLIEDAEKKVNAIAECLRHVDAKKKAVSDKGTTPPAKDSVVIIKILYPFIKSATVKEVVSKYNSGSKAWTRPPKAATYEPKTSW